MIGSLEINKVIRKILTPTLKENGFTKVNTRHNWAFIDHCIWVLDIAAVGKYFSDVTGWPPMSIHVELGIYYDFLPPENSDIKTGSKGELLPKVHQCQLRNDLFCNIDQANYTSHLNNSAEADRKDIWWIETDGSNIEEVISDIKHSFLNSGLDWFCKYTDLETAFNEIEKEHDSYNKFYKAKYFAKHLKDYAKFNEYSQLFEQEQKGIDSLFN